MPERKKSSDIGDITIDESRQQIIAMIGGGIKQAVMGQIPFLRGDELFKIGDTLVHLIEMGDKTQEDLRGEYYTLLSRLGYSPTEILKIPLLKDYAPF